MTNAGDVMRGNRCGTNNAYLVHAVVFPESENGLEPGKVGAEKGTGEEGSLVRAGYFLHIPTRDRNMGVICIVLQ